MAEAGADITDNQAAERYEATIDGHRAELTYSRDGDRITFHHTRVPESLEGRGLGSRLARRALDDARDQGLTVVPECPFVRGYIKKHREYAPLVDDAFQPQVR